MLFKKKDKFNLPSKMDMKILQNEDLCYFQNSGIDQCCVIFQFLISLFSVDRLSLYVSSCDFITSVILQCSLLTILHTHKRCGFCLRKARVPDTNSIISRFNVCVKKKQLKTIKLQASTEVYEFNRI